MGSFCCLLYTSDYDNLLTVDVVCHGVPSAKVYNKHLQEIAAAANEEVQQEMCIRDRWIMDGLCKSSKSSVCEAAPLISAAL